MRKILLFIGLPVVVISICWMFAVSWPVAPPIKAEPLVLPKYAIGGQQNKSKSGSVVYWSLVREDETYVFITDEKRRPKQPLLLCYLNYTSTQGSFDPKWSKDKQMMAVYNPPNECCPDDEEWITGYDWKTGEILKSKAIPAAFSKHKGVGESCLIYVDRAPTAEEIKQYKPERLGR